MKRFLYLATALTPLLALSAPPAQAYPSCGKWPTLCHLNGPALDGRAVALPHGPSGDGASEADEVQGLSSNGPALDGRPVALPDQVGRSIERRLLPVETGPVSSTDLRWPTAEQHAAVRQ